MGRSKAFTPEVSDIASRIYECEVIFMDQAAVLRQDVMLVLSQVNLLRDQRTRIGSTMPNGSQPWRRIVGLNLVILTSEYVATAARQSRENCRCSTGPINILHPQLIYKLPQHVMHAIIVERTRLQ